MQIHEVGEHDGLPFFSLEFCTGGSLADHLDGTPLPPGQAAELLETLAELDRVTKKNGFIENKVKTG